jgi:hypothetical protein
MTMFKPIWAVETRWIRRTRVVLEFPIALSLHVYHAVRMAFVGAYLCWITDPKQ